ncbi:MAG: hypothetical protein ACQXXJ_04485 [Candidatus Bathyarchaeia archaeon]
MTETCHTPAGVNVNAPAAFPAVSAAKQQKTPSAHANKRRHAYAAGDAAAPTMQQPYKHILHK